MEVSDLKAGEFYAGKGFVMDGIEGLGKEEAGMILS